MRPHEPTCHTAILVQKHGCGKSPDSHPACGIPLLVQQDLQSKALFRLQTPEPRHTLFDRYCHQSDGPVGGVSVKPFPGRQLLPTSASPAGPEDEQKGFAFSILDPDRLAFEIPER